MKNLTRSAKLALSKSNMSLPFKRQRTQCTTENATMFSFKQNLIQSISNDFVKNHFEHNADYSMSVTHLTEMFHLWVSSNHQCILVCDLWNGCEFVEVFELAVTLAFGNTCIIRGNDNTSFNIKYTLPICNNNDSDSFECNTNDNVNKQDYNQLNERDMFVSSDMERVDDNLNKMDAGLLEITQTTLNASIDYKTCSLLDENLIITTKPPSWSVESFTTYMNSKYCNQFDIVDKDEKKYYHCKIDGHEVVFFDGKRYRYQNVLRHFEKEDHDDKAKTVIIEVTKGCTGYIPNNNDCCILLTANTQSKNQNYIVSWHEMALKHQNCLNISSGSSGICSNCLSIPSTKYYKQQLLSMINFCNEHKITHPTSNDIKRQTLEDIFNVLIFNSNIPQYKTVAFNDDISYILSILRQQRRQNKKNENQMFAKVRNLRQKFQEIKNSFANGDIMKGYNLLDNSLQLFQGLSETKDRNANEFVGIVLASSMQSLWSTLQAKSKYGFRWNENVQKFWYMMKHTTPRGYKLCRKYFGKAFVCARTYQPSINLRCDGLGILGPVIKHIPKYLDNNNYWMSNDQSKSIDKQVQFISVQVDATAVNGVIQHLQKANHAIGFSDSHNDKHWQIDTLLDIEQMFAQREIACDILTVLYVPAANIPPLPIAMYPITKKMNKNDFHYFLSLAIYCLKCEKVLSKIYSTNFDSLQCQNSLYEMLTSGYQICNGKHAGHVESISLPGLKVEACCDGHNDGYRVAPLLDNIHVEKRVYTHIIRQPFIFGSNLASLGYCIAAGANCKNENEVTPFVTGILYPTDTQDPNKMLALFSELGRQQMLSLQGNKSTIALSFCMDILDQICRNEDWHPLLKIQMAGMLHGTFMKALQDTSAQSKYFVWDRTLLRHLVKICDSYPLLYHIWSEYYPSQTSNASDVMETKCEPWFRDLRFQIGSDFSCYDVVHHIRHLIAINEIKHDLDEQNHFISPINASRNVLLSRSQIIQAWNFGKATLAGAFRYIVWQESLMQAPCELEGNNWKKYNNKSFCWNYNETLHMQMEAKNLNKTTEFHDNEKPKFLLLSNSIFDKCNNDEDEEDAPTELDLHCIIAPKTPTKTTITDDTAIIAYMKSMQCDSANETNQVAGTIEEQDADMIDTQPKMSKIDDNANEKTVDLVNVDTFVNVSNDSDSESISMDSNDGQPPTSDMETINFEFKMVMVNNNESDKLPIQSVIAKCQAFIDSMQKIFWNSTLHKNDYNQYLHQSQELYGKLKQHENYQQYLSILQQLQDLFYVCLVAKLMTNLGIKHTQRQRYTCLHRNRVPKHAMSSNYIKSQQHLISKNTAIKTIAAQMGVKRHDTSRTRLQRVKASGINNATLNKEKSANTIENSDYWVCDQVNNGNRLVKVLETRFKSRSARVPVSSITVAEASCYCIVEILHYNQLTKHVETFLSINRFTYVHSSQFVRQINVSQSNENMEIAEIDINLNVSNLPLLTSKLSEFNYHLTGISQIRKCSKCGKEYQMLTWYNKHVKDCKINSDNTDKKSSNKQMLPSPKRDKNQNNIINNIPTELNDLNNWLKYETLTLNEYIDRIMLLSTNHDIYSMSIMNVNATSNYNNITKVLRPLPVPSSIRKAQTYLTNENQRVVIDNKMVLTMAQCNILATIATKTIQRSTFVSLPHWFEMAASLKQSDFSSPYNDEQVLDGVTIENVRQTRDLLFGPSAKKLGDLLPVDCYVNDLIAIGAKNWFTSRALESYAALINDDYEHHTTKCLIVDPMFSRLLITKDNVNVNRLIDKYILTNKIKKKILKCKQKIQSICFMININNNHWIRETFDFQNETMIAHDTIPHQYNHQQMHNLIVFNNRIYDVLNNIWTNENTKNFIHWKNSFFLGYNFKSEGHSVLDTSIRQRNSYDCGFYVASGCEGETKNASYQWENDILVMFGRFRIIVKLAQYRSEVIELN